MIDDEIFDFGTLISIIKDCGAIVDKYKCTDCGIKLNSDSLTDHLHNNHKNYNGIFYFGFYTFFHLKRPFYTLEDLK
jgi:hypothetical protein